MENDEINIEILEFSLDNDEINKLIENLQKLKQTKSNFSFEIDDELELLIHHEDDEIDEEDEEDDYDEGEDSDDQDKYEEDDEDEKEMEGENE